MESTAKARKGRQQPTQGEMQGVLDLAAGTPPEPAQDTTSAKLPALVKRERPALLPLRHTDRDFFLADLFDYALKDDGASMEAPIFTLSTKADLSTWTWESKDGNRSVEVYPSIKGRATQFDKDVLIYVVSQMTEGLNRGRDDAKNRTVRFTVHDYLVSTNKPTGGAEYLRLENALERLRGTTIKTDIRTGGQRVKEGFGIIDSWTIIERAPDDERMIAVEVTLSKWLFNAVQAHEVLTIHRDYFRLRRPLERRLYELARKHCGHQTLWSIGLELLQEKAGSKGTLREFRRMVREIIEAHTLPEYRMTLDDADKVTFYVRNPQRLIAGLTKGNKADAVHSYTRNPKRVPPELDKGKGKP
ncbi:Plasmid replication initiator protein (plasmid) [Thauera humireducens]|uniref:replication initiator protein A n=1 Tax=Thauera humireducens TaxID=1134435 RepID=UPI002467A799|nr:replication initiator protein A [Thauera humireducens]CAH1749537.1 Plasmid replication initiator protein [Thauera humireducens]